jgi:hypothetical protein
MGVVSPLIEPPNSVLLLVGREEFDPSRTFAGATCVSTNDCVAVAVTSVDDGPTLVTVGPAPTTSLTRLGQFEIETEGQLSLRDIYNREYEVVGTDAGLVLVTVWADDEVQPAEVVFQVTAKPSP